MNVNNAGSADVNILQSDTVTFRDKDKPSNDGLAFVGGADLAAVASQYPHIQILNPSGSGIVVAVDKIVFTNVTNNSDYGIHTYNTALASNLTTIECTNIGAATPNAELREATNVAVLGDMFYVDRELAAVPAKNMFDYPLFLDEGQGIVAVSYSTNVTVRGNVFWREL